MFVHTVTHGNRQVFNNYSPVFVETVTVEMKRDLLNNKCCEQRLLFANTRKMDKHITQVKTGGDPHGYGKDHICSDIPD